MSLPKWQRGESDLNFLYKVTELEALILQLIKKCEAPCEIILGYTILDEAVCALRFGKQANAIYVTDRITLDARQIKLKEMYGAIDNTAYQVHVWTECMIDYTIDNNRSEAYIVNKEREIAQICVEIQKCINGLAKSDRSRYNQSIKGSQADLESRANLTSALTHFEGKALEPNHESDDKLKDGIELDIDVEKFGIASARTAAIMNAISTIDQVAPEEGQEKKHRRRRKLSRDPYKRANQLHFAFNAALKKTPYYNDTRFKRLVDVPGFGEYFSRIAGSGKPEPNLPDHYQDVLKNDFKEELLKGKIIGAIANGIKRIKKLAKLFYEAYINKKNKW